MNRDERAAQLNGTVKHHGTVFDLIDVPVVTPAGPTHFEFAVADDVVRVYPVDAEKYVWLIEEIRHGVSDRPVLRTVSGAMNDGESPVHAAQRELLEEAGIFSPRLYVLHESRPHLKLLNSVFHVVALDLEFREPRKERDEELEVLRVPLNSLEKMVWAGDFVEDTIALGILRLVRRETQRQSQR